MQLGCRAIIGRDEVTRQPQAVGRLTGRQINGPSLALGGFVELLVGCQGCSHGIDNRRVVWQQFLCTLRKIQGTRLGLLQQYPGDIVRRGSIVGHQILQAAKTLLCCREIPELHGLRRSIEKKLRVTWVVFHPCHQEALGLCGLAGRQIKFVHPNRHQAAAVTLQTGVEGGQRRWPGLLTRMNFGLQNIPN